MQFFKGTTVGSSHFWAAFYFPLDSNMSGRESVSVWGGRDKYSLDLMPTLDRVETESPS